jgi:hypothetical protein
MADVEEERRFVLYIWMFVKLERDGSVQTFDKRGPTPFQHGQFRQRLHQSVGYNLPVDKYLE